MAKFLLHYTSGVANEIVEAPNGIAEFIEQRFGHMNEYLKLGGATPQLIEEPIAVVSMAEFAAEPAVVEAAPDA